jgi:HSP20 family protein
MQNKLKMNPVSFGNIFENFINNELPYSYFNDFRGSINPPVNIIENNDNYTLSMAAPGLKKEDFNLKIDKNMLTISYEHANMSQEDKLLRQEFSIRSFKRQFSLHDKIDIANIVANYNNGILTVILGKKEKEAPKTIDISVQ